VQGERSLTHAGYAWHVFAYFPCNTSGVRVAVCKTSQGAERAARAFARKNKVHVTWRRMPPQPHSASRN